MKKYCLICNVHRLDSSFFFFFLPKKAALAKGFRPAGETNLQECGCDIVCPHCQLALVIVVPLLSHSRMHQCWSLIFDNASAAGIYPLISGF